MESSDEIDTNEPTRILQGGDATTGDPETTTEPGESKDPSVPIKPAFEKKRKLIVCIDGTSNQFSDKNTNVVELYRYIKKDDDQLTYYDSGIGTFAKPSWRSWSYYKQALYNFIDLAIAWNLEKTIIGAYRWLSDTYKTGDQIFLFGFSRGAYQVRALAAMIENVGLIYAGNQAQIPFAWELYASHESNREGYQSMILNFKQTFSHDSVDLHFVGVWDTVSSVGIFRGALLPLTDVCRHITHFRHALALDECRVKFDAEYVSPGAALNRRENTLKEVWFAGTHSDIGGGNKENLNLSSGNVPLRWMMEEAKSAGLVLSETHQYVRVNLAYVTNVEITNSMGNWWFMEWLLPFTWYLHRPKESTRTWGLHRGRGRMVLPRQKIHWTVGVNYEDAPKENGYHPEASLASDSKTPVLWSEMFETFESHKSAVGPVRPQGNVPEWEGDKSLAKTLHNMKQFIKYKGSQKQEQWLKRLDDDTAESDQLNAIWVYGGTSFLQEVAVACRDNHSELSKRIIRTAIGFRDGDTNIDAVTTIFLRLNDLVPLCKYPASAYPDEPTKSSAHPQGLMALFSWFRRAATNNTAPTPYSFELALIVMELLNDLSKNRQYVDKMCSSADVTFVQSLPASIPTLYSGRLDERPPSEIFHKDLSLATQIIEALVPIANHDKGRQSLLASGITEKLLEILKIDVGDNLVFQAMRIFRALSEQEDIQDFEKFSRDVAQPIIKLLERTTLEDRTIEEILGTLELLALSTNFQSSLIQQPLVDIIQELLKKGEDAVTEGVLRVVAMIMCLSDGSEDGPNIKLIDPNSLFPLLKKMPLSYKVLEALINIAPYYTEECISSGFLDVLILAVQSDKLPAMDARAKVSTEERDFVEDINFAEAIKSSGAQQYLEIARSFVSVLVKIIPRTSGMTVLEGLTSITSFVQQGGVVANTEDIVRLVTWVLNQAYQKWHGGSEIFGYLYTEILWESINLLNALEDNSPANRQALLESGAYKLVLLLANIPDIAHKLLNQTVEYMRDLDDDRLNAEVNKYSAPLHLNGASDTLLSDSTSRYLATELAEHTHGDPYGERLKLSMARSNSL